MPMPPRHRLDTLDLLRALACAMVVAFHFLFRGQAAGWLQDAPPAWLSTLARHGHLGVPLFFMISGFVISMSAEGASLRAFAASRIARLVPALWVAAPLTALVALAGDVQAFVVTPGQLLVNLTLVPQWFGVPYVDGVYWSLAVELQFYLLVALALVVRRLDTIEPWLVIWLLLALLDGMRPMYPLERWLVVTWAPFFVAGICCHLIHRRGATPLRWGLLAASYVLALVAVATRRELVIAPGPAHPADLPVAATLVSLFFLAFLLIVLRRWELRASAWLRVAGALTYPVYLLHQNIGYVLIELPAWADWPFLLRAAAVTLFVGGLAWTVHVRVERTLGPRLRAWVGSWSSAARNRPVSPGRQP
jgi:peptidoglycan/LPS O-acetylase OafA/YrhL